MAIDRFFIAPYDKDSGLQKNYKPFLIPDEAFAELTNAYVFRGRVRKRFGSRWFGNDQLSSRFRIAIGTTGPNGGQGWPAGYFTGTTPTNAGVLITLPAIGQLFSVGSEVFTVVANAAPFTLLRTGPNVDVCTFNTVTGVVTLTNALPNTTVYYYPALPVMGLRTYEAPQINDEVIIGFDTRFAYRYAGTGWERIALETTVGAASWSGSDSQFFNTCTWLGLDAAIKIFFITNFNQIEPWSMRSYNGTTMTSFRPLTNLAAPLGTQNLLSAQIIIPFKNRLVALNTWEGTLTAVPPIVPLAQTNYPNRARYSQIGSPLDADAWRQDIPGRGNFVDAATTEAITSAQFIKDRLIVFFERSTWELAYTGNQAYPFVWQQINNELGCESSFSVVPFDKVAIGVGNVGIHACNGLNVTRIDQKIPSEVFNIHNLDDGVYRVYGIRDYTVEMVYWTFPDDSRTALSHFPNRILVFNYQTGTWSFNDDSITCFGYYYPSTAITWDSNISWDDSEVTWDSGALDAQNETVVGGNQEGYTFIIEADFTVNAPVIQITNLTVVAGLATVVAVNHNMKINEYIYLQDIVATAGTLTTLNNTIVQINNVVDKDTFTFITLPQTGIYLGNGVISRVSNINIKTKEYNFYVDKGRNAYISHVDFLVDKTDFGEINVDYYLSTSFSSSAQNGALILGSNTLETFPYASIQSEISTNQSRLWHPMYFNAEGECIQLSFNMDDDQMRNIYIRSSSFTLHAMCFHAMPSSMRLQ
jgi:hypothetical protein